MVSASVRMTDPRWWTGGGCTAPPEGRNGAAKKRGRGKVPVLPRPTSGCSTCYLPLSVLDVLVTGGAMHPLGAHLDLGRTQLLGLLGRDQVGRLRAIDIGKTRLLEQRLQVFVLQVEGLGHFVRAALVEQGLDLGR